ncbi:multiple ankyrin repeats single kh domain-containing protein [Diplodia corticola]|uniref:Multiple ankyrin repeats single kh domain-containing protein n=1 Tax=Diplodia corticola TaxID=236234 RepID=A0A1J9RHY8_9PEZI|nr:multiple ankyrin repeats single kh domain-containing protein [Diplodia corticola]OJD32171.1 multiple ankyrin repeats single kh domain-containing protein [Diplodia corticola]
MGDQHTSDSPEQYRVMKQGMEILRDPDGNASVDIVAVPGLGAHPVTSWTHPDTKFNWLRDSDGLAKDFPTARVLLFQYGSAWVGSLKVKQCLDSIAESLLNALISEREKCERRPIVFIGHSMGGLVIAKAVCIAGFHTSDYPNVFEAICGCVFFGTPFDGAEVANVAAMYASTAELLSPNGHAQASALLDVMKPGNQYLQGLKKDFLRLVRKLAGNIQIACLWEVFETDFPEMVGMRDNKIVRKVFDVLIPQGRKKFVDKEASILVGYDECGLQSAHRNLVHFTGFKDPKYQMMRTPLRKVVEKARLVAKSRFSCTRDVDRDMVRDILDSLEGVHIQRKRDTLRAKVNSQSWIIEEQEYKDWFRLQPSTELPEDGQTPSETTRSQDGCDERCLWIRGAEGKGKTSAVLATIDRISDLSSEAEENNSRPVLCAFFFCDKSSDGSSAEELLKSIMRQLVYQQERLAKYVKQFRKKEGKGSTSQGGPSQASMSVENLWQGLRDMFADRFVGAIYIVVSNLHELPESADGSTQKLLQLLHQKLKDGDIDDAQKVRVRWLFTGRERSNLKKALPRTGVRSIDLDDEEHHGKVKSEVQSHAENMIADLGAEKQYNMAVLYFAISLVGKRAETKKWVDVTCVHLAALPPGSSDLQVRHLLEGVPQDVKTLLNGAWESLLKGNDPDTAASIKEMLRTLILTNEDLTEEELSILTGLSSTSQDKDKLRKLVKQCSPLLSFRESEGGKQVVSFVLEDIKTHLDTCSENLLGLCEEGRKLQQGMVALRCFSYIMKAGRQHSAPSGNDNPASTEASEVPNLSQNQDLEDEGKLLSYPIKYWLQHSSKATADIARILSEKEEFWKPGSDIRLWWTQAISDGKDDFKRLMVVGQFKIEDLTALHLASCVGYAELVAALIDRSPKEEVNREIGAGVTPLHLAAYFGHEEVVEVLLDKAFDKAYDKAPAIDVGDCANAPPLAFAALPGNLSVIKLLLANGADPRASPKEWPTLCTGAAILSGKIEAVTLLVDKDAPLTDGTPLDVNLYDDTPSPLALSAVCSDISIFDYVLRKGEGQFTERDYRHAFSDAAAAGRKDALEKLLETQPSRELFQSALDRAAKEESALEAAAEDTDELPEVLRAIWENTGGDLPQDVIDDCLYQATDNEKQTTVEKLLDPDTFRANANARGEKYGNALTAATNDGTTDIIEMLLKSGADVKSEHGWALQAAAAQGHLNVVNQLLEERVGADVNACTDNPHFPAGTALQAACEAGWSEIVGTLLAKGADPNLGKGERSPPVCVAANKGEESILQRLMGDSNLNLNVLGGPDKSTPLVHAAFNCPTATVQQMIKKGAEVNMANVDGDTALIVAARRGDAGILGFLLDNGADMMRVSKRNETALEVALEKNNVECATLLAVRASSILRAIDGLTQSHPDMMQTIRQQSKGIYDDRSFMGQRPSRPEDPDDTDLEARNARLVKIGLHHYPPPSKS